MPKINNIWKLFEAKKTYTRVSSEGDLLVALNYYKPGYKNQFHNHTGTSQSFLVLKGELTLRTRKAIDAPVEENVLHEGECCMMATGEYYQLENSSPSEPLLLYQAKQPTDMVQIYGKEPVNSREYFGDAI